MAKFSHEMFEKFMEMNEGREGDVALTPLGKPIVGSKYLGNGSYAARFSGGFHAGVGIYSYNPIDEKMDKVVLDGAALNHLLRI